MIDIHSHILYGIDDGAKNEEMTLSMLRIAAQEGLLHIVATPHFIYGANRYRMETLKARFDEIRELIKENKLDIRIYEGNELFLDEYLRECLGNKQCNTLAGTRYVLVELPVVGFPKNTENLLSGLLSDGYVPVLAHVERYDEVQKNPDVLQRFIELGCLAQLNCTSITGLAGKKEQETAKLLLQCNMGHLAASDSHSNRRRAPRMKEAYNTVIGWLGEERARRIFNINPECILKNSMMELDKPVEAGKKRFFIYSIAKFFANGGQKVAK